MKGEVNFRKLSYELIESDTQTAGMTFPPKRGETFILLNIKLHHTYQDFVDTVIHEFVHAL